MTPRAVWRNLCGNRETDDETQHASVVPRNTNSSDKLEPPPYCAPPRYEEVVMDWPQEPPPYTICITQHDVSVVSEIPSAVANNQT